MKQGDLQGDSDIGAMGFLYHINPSVMEPEGEDNDSKSDVGNV